MLTIFPSLLIFGIFAPLLLRTVVGIYFFYTGYQRLQEKHGDFIEKLTQKYGDNARLFIVCIALVEIVIGASLVLGFLTQIMTLVGMVYILKLLWFKNVYPTFAKHERIFYIMVFFILFSLLLTGAGAPAIDLPL